MVGNSIGAKKTAKKLRALYGDDFFARNGRIGGKRSRTGGFASDKIGKDGLTGRQRAMIAGRRGGLISRRGKSK